MFITLLSGEKAAIGDTGRKKHTQLNPDVGKRLRLLVPAVGDTTVESPLLEVNDEKPGRR